MTRLEDAVWSIHADHPSGFMATSREFKDIRRFCCDNCGLHHWGRYSGRWENGDLDFDYIDPHGARYTCRSGHIIDGPEYCAGECSRCRS